MTDFNLDATYGKRKSYVIAYLALIFLGWLGVHRYYVGRWKSGFLYMITMGFFGLGLLLDFYLLYFMVKQARQQAKIGINQPNFIPSFKKLFLSSKQEDLAPWMSQETNNFYRILDISDDIARVLLFIIAPLLIIFLSVFIDGALIVGIIMLFILVLVGYVNNMNYTLTIIEQTFKKYPHLSGIPLLSDAVDTVRNFYDYYYNNKPKNIIYYLFYPVIILFKIFPKSDRTELKLYGNIVLVILITLILESIFSSKSSYLSIWTTMENIILVILMIFFFSILPFITIVTTSFKFRLSGKQKRINKITTITLLLSILLFIGTQQEDMQRNNVSFNSSLNVESNMDVLIFREDLSVTTDMFLSYYHKKIMPFELQNNIQVHQNLTDLYHRHIGGLVSENEAKMFKIFTLPEPDTQNSDKRWLGVHYSNLSFGQIEKPIILFMISPDGNFYSSWKKLPTNIQTQFTIIPFKTNIDMETYVFNEISRPILMQEYIP